ncbi:alpha-amylase [Streptomyces sp. NPDC086080]|uniref:alpha-amylase n=1 Tax=Streptomyces sp. NPDC086080 TaxID=3365748 RepID=UPI0037CD90A3
MKRPVRSTFVACSVVLAVASSGTAAHAGPAENTGSETPAPACVTFSAGWRYTFVTNGCPTTHTVRVVYGDGMQVPHREVPPGAVVTFPGYGTTGNTVQGVVLYDGTDGS